MVIATPGRLLAHMKLGYVDLSGVEYFILDEADRMFDMGFLPDVRRIIAAQDSVRDRLALRLLLNYALRKGALKPAPDIQIQQGVVEMMAALELDCDICHCHEWQTGLVPVYLRTLYADRPREEWKAS